MILDWNSYRQNPRTILLGDLGLDHIPVGNSFLRVAEEEYVGLDCWNGEFDKSTKVIDFYWAASLGAFSRVMDRANVKSDDGVSSRLPAGVYSVVEGMTFGDLLSDAESGMQNWTHGSPGGFEGSHLRIGLTVFYFRSPKPVPTDESPFGVRMCLQSWKGQPIGC